MRKHLPGESPILQVYAHRMDGFSEHRESLGAAFLG
jgi:hypothetical protein